MEELCRHPYTDSEKKAIISLFGRLKEWSLGAVLHEMTLANIDIPEHFTQMVRAITHLENICNSINLKNDELSFNATPLSFETIAAECIKSHLLSLNNLAKRVSWWKDRDSSVTLPAREIFENL